MNAEPQLLHLRRYNAWWAANARRVRKSCVEEAWSRGVDHARLATGAINEARLDSNVPLMPLMQSEQI